VIPGWFPAFVASFRPYPARRSESAPPSSEPASASGRASPPLDAALRIARAEGATVVPAYLAVVPLSVALETPLRKEADAALPLLEAVEQRAATMGVSVDSRIERGRTVRQALRLLMENESFDRVVAAGASNGHDGFSSDDIA
jgi:hypothetical protein